MTRDSENSKRRDAASTLGHTSQNTSRADGATECGELQTGWSWKLLAEVAEDGVPILYGILQPGPDTPGGVPYVRPTEIVADVIDLSSIRRTTTAIAGKYKQPVAPDDANPLPVPEGWACASVDQITENFDGRRVPLKSADRDKRSGQYPYYGASGIIDDIDDYLFDGDYLLIAEDGANLISRSTPIAFRVTGKFWVNNHAHIVQTRGEIPLAYLSIFLNGKDLSFSVTGSAQPKLTQAAMNKIPIPIPPLAEQTRIVAEVERRLIVVEELESVVTANLQRATRLRQSIFRRRRTMGVKGAVGELERGESHTHPRNAFEMVQSNRLKI